MLKKFNIQFLIYLSFFLIPIKLSLALIVIIPLILIYLLKDFSIKDLFIDSYKYLTYFFIVSFLNFFVFINYKSFFSLMSFYFYALLVPVIIKYVDVKKKYFLIGLLALGQAISSLHTIFQEAFGEDIIHDYFVGKISESGQLALTLPLMIGVILSDKSEKNFKDIFYSIVFFIFGILFGFSNQISKNYFFILCVLFLIVFIVMLCLTKKTFIQSIKKFVLLYLPICSCAFILNLKRGPWMGVGVGVILLILKYNKKLLFPLCAVGGMIFLFVMPVRDRILNSENHFFISGGRSSIWAVGEELMTRYPMGMGFKNSRNLSEYSVDIPNNLNHFHNNLLNIVVEFGIVGFLLYLSWILSFLRSSLRRNDLSFIIGVSILSSQIAGLVEYNFGDSEVLLLTYLLMGLAIKIQNSNT